MHVSAMAAHPHGVAVVHPTPLGIHRVQLDEEIAGAPAMPLHVAVPGVQEVQRLPGDELQALAGRDVAGRRERIEALCFQRRRIELGWRWRSPQHALPYAGLWSRP
jgi:hypothetical protein